MTVQPECKQSEPEDKIGTPEEIAKAVHHYLDWVRACNKRPDDHRGFDTESLLKRCQEGYPLTKYFPTHYEGE